MAKQLNLFNQPSLNIGKSLKEQLAQSAKGSQYSRDELLDRMNDLAERYGVRLVKGNGRGLTMATLEKWLNPGAMEHIPGVNGLLIFCAALDDLEPIRELLAPLGGEVIHGSDVSLLQWAKRYHQAKNLRKEMKQLEDEL